MFGSRLKEVSYLGAEKTSREWVWGKLRGGRSLTMKTVSDHAGRIRSFRTFIRRLMPIAGAELKRGEVRMIASLGTNAALQQQQVQNLREIDLRLPPEARSLLDFLYNATLHLRVFTVSPGTP